MVRHLVIQRQNDWPSGLKRSISTQETAIAVALGLLALGVYIWQLSVPELLSFYDSGVYFAASFHLVSGVVPYKDFTFVQPPGILLLMSPIALISRSVGTHDGFVMARIFTSFATALNVSLLALLVRHRGRLAMIIAGVVLALLPVTFFVSSTVKLEPFCIVFVLLGSLVILWDQNDYYRATTRALVIGGALFGCAALIKLWAVFPFIALVICLAPRCRKRLALFAGSAAVSFSVLALPFLVIAPSNFVHEVFLDQLTRKANPTEAAGILYRLIDITGLANSSVAPSTRGVVIAIVVMLLITVTAFARRRDSELVDTYLLLASTIIVLSLLVAPEFYLYYGYFSAPFVVGVFAISIARLGRPIQVLFAHLSLTRGVRQIITWTSAAAGILLIASLTLYSTTFYANYVWRWGIYAPYLSSINKKIPSGSCVVYNYVIYGVYSNRLDSTDQNCPSEVDATGMWMKWGYHLTSPSPGFVAEWKSYFNSAQYVVLNSPRTPFVPWNQSLAKWFETHFRLIYGQRYVFIYANNAKS